MEPALIAVHNCIPANFFWDTRCEIFFLGVLGFLKTTQSFRKILEDVRSLPKKSDVFRRRLKSQSQSWDGCKCKLAPSAFHFKNKRLRGRYCHLFILHMVFVPHMSLSQHIFGKCAKTDSNNSCFSIRSEKLTRRPEPAWDWSFQPAGVRLTLKTQAQGARVGRYIIVIPSFNCLLVSVLFDSTSLSKWNTWNDH